MFKKRCITLLIWTIVILTLAYKLSIFACNWIMWTILWLVTVALLST